MYNALSKVDGKEWDGTKKVQLGVKNFTVDRQRKPSVASAYISMLRML